ncbi:MAG: undecaprenyl/decaprenyl-phosphate alpha-N-acetylglucosaminyl 1-phosphate transferase [Firmicutes bacterium]|nr:undecaprenyl/decaprenyl-phosphate alpha-N-acetylglucosaminyl 1-phosphate transferase [Bacillota bacterium]
MRIEFLAPGLALIMSLILTPVFKRLAFKLGAVDLPNARKIHRKAMPLFGGLAIYLSFWLAALLILFAVGGGEKLWGIFWGGTLILCLGIYDDLRGLSYKVKFAGQFIAAFLLLIYNIKIEFITLPFQDMVSLGIFLIVPLTLLWVVGITNAVNLIDGVDGLATGVSTIAAVVIFALTWGKFPVLIPLLVLTLAGAALGFLPYNFAPARIFLGDAGSLFLGFMLAGFSIMGLTKQATLTTLIIPVLILGLPITDTFYAIWRRFRNRRPIFQADNGHIHHRLLGLGLSTRQTVMILYFSSIYFGASALIFDRLPWLNIYFIPVIFLIFIFALRHLKTLGNLLSAFNGYSYQDEQKREQKR